MPKAFQLCSEQGCLEVATDDRGRCDDHTRGPWVNTSARNKKRPRDWPSRRRFVLRRDRVCQLCGADEMLEVDHKIPVSAGGGWEYANLWVLCRGCHRTKTFRDISPD